MEANEYTKMEEYEKHYWWHKGKLLLLKFLHKKYLEGRKDLKILEIGCGTGEVLKLLDNWGQVTGLDYSEQAIEICKNKGFEDLIEGDISTLDLTGLYGKYDMVLASDVLEHIREDVNAMKVVWELLKPGGLFFVTVPAYKFLWSTHDEALHHLRRYHSLEIKTKIRDSGFKVLKHTHFVAFMFFPIASVRLLNNFVRRRAYAKSHYLSLPKRLNNLLTWLLKIETKLIDFMYLPVGTTHVVVALKEND